jgi:polyhydroxyalkanoate synthesis regulator phasin
MFYYPIRSQRFPDLRNLLRSISGVGMKDKSISCVTKAENGRDDIKGPIRAITRTFSHVVEFVHEDLMAYIRTIFLQIVRVRYWHHISEGKLPRLSFSAQTLLYSIDVGLDNVQRCYKPGLDNFSDDWIYIKKTISSDEKLLLSILSFFDQLIPDCLNFGTFRYNYGWASARRDKRSVYMLMSFIEAHEHAQNKIHDFVGELEPTEESIGIPEENYVIAESVASVKMAKKLLSEIDAEQVSVIVRQQISRTVLAKQTQFVNDMVSEGLLTSKDAEAFYSEISEDVKKCDKMRDEANREQSQRAADLLRSTLTLDPNMSLRARLLVDGEDEEDGKAES